MKEYSKGIYVKFKPEEVEIAYSARTEQPARFSGKAVRSKREVF